MFTSEDVDAIVKNFLKVDKFHVLRYDLDSSKSQIEIKIQTDVENKTARQVTRMLFNIKPFLNHPDFQKKEGIICNEFIEKINLNFDFTPTYFIKGVFVYQDKSDAEFMIAKNPDLDPDHIKVIIRTLANYHAESISFEEKKSEELGEMFRVPHEYPIFLETAQKRDENLLKLSSTLMKSFVKNENAKFAEHLTTIVEGSLKRKTKNTIRKVLCFGPTCAEGVLFKYKDEVPIQCKLVNFNQQHYSPPAYDVLQFIYAVSDKGFRQRHLHDLLEFYYGCLKDELKIRNLDLKEIISLEDFEISTHRLIPLIQLHSLSTSCLKSEFPLDTDRELLTKSVEGFELVHPDLSLEDCFKIVKNKIGTTNYNLLELQMLPLGKVSGFFGDHKKLKIKIQVDNAPKILNFFVKFTPKGKAQKSIADDFGSFFKENFFYRHFVTKAEKFSPTINECTVPCYFTRLDDVLVFEDFEIRGYGILDHRKPLTDELVEVIVKQLAKLHASSIILEEKLSEQTKTEFRLNEHYGEALKESFFSQVPNHQGAKSTEISIVAVKDQIRLFPDPNSQFSDETFREKLTTAYDLAYELVKPSQEFRNVVCHGDLWINNILVQQTNGKPTDCRFIDFQIVRYCPPAHDLLGFLYLATNRSYRKKHMQQVIDLYYKEFSNALETCGCDVENVYSYEHFRKSIDYMLPQTVCQTAIYYHICLTDPDLMKDYVSTEDKMKQIFLVDRRDFIAEMCERDPIYKERNKEAVEDLRDLCVKYF